MSEQTTTLDILIFIASNIFGIYFAYKLIVELYHYLTKKDEDFL